MLVTPETAGDVQGAALVLYVALLIIQDFWSLLEWNPGWKKKDLKICIICCSTSCALHVEATA